MKEDANFLIASIQVRKRAVIRHTLENKKELVNTLKEFLEKENIPYKIKDTPLKTVFLRLN